jgi:hypothetical protein
MTKLEHAKIYRGGITAPYLNTETSKCSFEANIKNRTLDFRFELGSKGGGTTSVLLQVGLDDSPLLLEGMAKLLKASASVTIGK